MCRGGIKFALGSLLLLISFHCDGQNLALGSKKSIYSFLGALPSNNHLTLDAFTGVSLLENDLLIAVDLAYTRETPDYPDYYSDHINLEGLGQKSFAVGLFGRYYFLPGELKLYLEPGIYYNYLNIEEPVVIPHGYGAFTRIIENQEWLWSAHLGTGLAVRVENVEVGLHFQWGWIQDFTEEKRAGNPVRLASNLRFDNGRAFYFSPLSFTYNFRSESNDAHPDRFEN